ncbi:MAG: hypothetical protein FJW37_06285, partial [Acidobacteria bacterium]|nr:hypothetical protein [Acidobacteriota bacterium]
SAFWLSLAPLVSLAWLGLARMPQQISWPGQDQAGDRRMFRAAWQSAVFVSLLYAAISWQQASVDTLLASSLSHLLVFLIVFLVWRVIRAVAGATRQPARLQFLLCHVALGAAIWAAALTVAFRPLSFGGLAAHVYGAALGAAAALALASATARLRPDEPFARAPALAALAGLAWLAAAATSAMDWNYLLQKLAALAVWVLAFACCYLGARPAEGVRERPALMLLSALLALAGYTSTQAARLEPVLEHYAGYDVSFRLIRETLAPKPQDQSFYRFLAQNTNLSRWTRVAPVEVELVPTPTRPAAAKPHIFIFVMDSLRRDYLGVYNPEVKFTPNIDAFARRSTVFRSAFTRYGGTGLSEPSIWAGGMLLHKQYVTPFYPMNALQKLLDRQQYQSYVSRDSVLGALLKPQPSTTDLDQDRPEMDYDLCATLAELEKRLGRTPSFVYTQPQNLHISVIRRQGGGALDQAMTMLGQGARRGDAREYHGLYAPYASRLARIDQCFGAFLRMLEARGLYRNSLIVLTADHGDSLGEEGRWGHAYTIFPEIIRVPLIVHLPETWRSMKSNPDAPAFLTDITPSLYYLLGHRPVAVNRISGRPLFTKKLDEQAPYLRKHYLIASSYGPVYGLLSDQGRSLYIVDAVNYRGSFHRLGPGARQRSAAEYEGLIREEIGAINRFWGWQ